MDANRDRRTGYPGELFEKGGDHIDHSQEYFQEFAVTRGKIAGLEEKVASLSAILTAKIDEREKADIARFVAMRDLLEVRISDLREAVASVEKRAFNGLDSRLYNIEISFNQLSDDVNRIRREIDGLHNLWWMPYWKRTLMALVLLLCGSISILMLQKVLRW